MLEDRPLEVLRCDTQRAQISSSLSSMFGMPLAIGKRRPVSGHIRAPSSTTTCPGVIASMQPSSLHSSLSPHLH